MSALVVVRELASEFEATLAKNILADAGIESVIQTDTFAPYIVRPTWRLLVRERDSAEATRLLGQAPEQPD
jgi:hypothetical protein